jgi:hypothetical protein
LDFKKLTRGDSNCINRFVSIKKSGSNCGRRVDRFSNERCINSDDAMVRCQNTIDVLKTAVSMMQLNSFTRCHALVNLQRMKYKSGIVTSMWISQFLDLAKDKLRIKIRYF